MTVSILPQSPFGKAKRIKEFRRKIVAKSPAALKAEIIVHLEHLKQLGRIAEILKEARHE
jgi:hypothetical protein